MSFLEIIVYTSIIVWIFPVVRHIQSRFAYYFLLWAVIDPIKIFLFYGFGVDIQLLTIPFSLLLLYAIFEKNFTMKQNLLILLLIILLSIIDYSLELTLFIKISVHVIILIYLLVQVSDQFLQSHFINIFVLFIAFYELSIIIKNITVIGDLVGKEYFFHLTTIFQLLFGLFFTFVKEWKVKVE